MNCNEEAITAVLAGDINRFAQIVRCQEAEVRRLVKWYVKDPALEDDIVQETFFKAFKSLATLSDPHKLEPWLKTIARRCIVDQFRRQLPEDLNGNHEQTAVQLAIGEQHHVSTRDERWIWSEVECLDSIYQEVLRRRYVECQSYAEIAQALNLPESTIRGRLFEARQRLRKRLESKGLLP
jgi:RNA polymerase sigma-70 factor (ECF subfamily)